MNGVDFSEVGDLAAISARDSFQSDKALEYKEKAVEELDVYKRQEQISELDASITFLYRRGHNTELYIIIDLSLIHI